ncbi:MAG: hypothetical protein DRN71_01630 [Candidatus Nanohalarchaeota archaeon]|nr:MAG: hypothetical protein DRN71_01630 [Candidatus Nanohaloarchaeota archaeon]
MWAKPGKPGRGAFMGIEIIKQIMFIGTLIVAALILTASTRTAIGLTDADLQVITEQTTYAVVSILINIASVEQGVRHFDLKENFVYELNETHLRLTYIGKTGTLTDNLGTVHTFAVPHYRENIMPNSITEGTERICVSKRIINCRPEITICNEGEECCTIHTNDCKYIAY